MTTASDNCFPLPVWNNCIEPIQSRELSDRFAAKTWRESGMLIVIQSGASSPLIDPLGCHICGIRRAWVSYKINSVGQQHGRKVNIINSMPTQNTKFFIGKNVKVLSYSLIQFLLKYYKRCQRLPL